MTKFPFDATAEELAAKLDSFVDVVFESLESEFLIMPRGPGFVDYTTFEHAYQELRIGTGGFAELRPEPVLEVASSTPLVLVVLRSILGLTPSEWAYLASQRTGLKVSQAYARSLDRGIRMAPGKTVSLAGPRIEALVSCACELIAEPGTEVGPDRLHRFDKADTCDGLSSLRQVSALGVPYAMLLYERFLGRPFAGHRDSISELIGAGLESKIEDVLVAAGVSYRKTKRAERLAGFDQAPDFLIPDEFAPAVAIEAKLTEDDGTARDKVTRVQHLAEIRRRRIAAGEQPLEVVACIAGRGFGVRREDMKKLLLATQGKVFTFKTLGSLVDSTGLARFRARPASSSTGG